MRFLWIALLFIACSQAPVKKDPAPVETPVETTPVESPAKVFYTTQLDAEWIQKGIKTATCVTTLPSFLNELIQIQSFDMSEDTGAQVATNLIKDEAVQVGTYATWWPWSAANGYRDPASNQVFINTRKDPWAWSPGQLTNFLIHERSHFFGYGHGDNSPVGKENTVPYKVGSLAEKHVEGCL